MQNIGANNADDAFYRYKMPKLVAKVEGRGNGIKTNIVNNVDIARALDRPPTYTIKHFGCELGAQTNFDKKTGTSIVNGAHDAKKLSEILEIFIKKYVQCYNCGNPETVVKVRRECIHLKCKACGHTSDVDMRDKLANFIVKNPPDNKLSKAEAKVKKAEKERLKEAEKDVQRAEKAEKKKRKDSTKKDRKGSKPSSEDGSGEDKPEDVSAVAAPAEDEGGEEEEQEEEEEDTVWATDMSEDAIRKRQAEQLTAAAARLVQGGSKAVKVKEDGVKEDESVVPEETKQEEEEEEEDESELDPVTRVRAYFSSKSPLQLAAAMEELKVEGGIVGRMKVFYHALLDGCEGRFLDRIQAKDKFVLALAQDPTSQASHLIALEYYLTQVAPERKVEMPFILKMLYEEDLIDEDIIIMWGEQSAVAKKHGVDKASAKEVRELSEKVLEWLQEDSDEDDGSDDEDEDDE